MSERQTKLSLLFKKPFEPAFMPHNDKCLNIPDNFLKDEYKGRNLQATSRFGIQKLSVNGMVNQEDIKFAEGVKSFSTFDANHRNIAGRLVKYLMERSNFEEFIAAAAFAKDRLDPYLFQYALAVASGHRSDTKNLIQPTIVQVFPEQLIEPRIFSKLRQEINVAASDQERQVVTIDPSTTASDRELEHRMAYFREDIGVNIHHWHWHLVYPALDEPAEVVCKDRRGELFYYMHSQIIARYNVDRLANNLPRVVPLSNVREAIPEGYFPKLIRTESQNAYSPRLAGSFLRDLNRTDQVVSLDDMERWRDRIFQVIDQGFAFGPNGCRIELTEDSGIDLLGDMIEASSKSPNKQLYGDLHNLGHILISRIHDPDERHLDEIGVMGDLATTMRDPLFYRWHSFIDNIFGRYKNTLAPYPDSNLRFDGITIQSISVQIASEQGDLNSLSTFWQQSEVDLQAGLDFGQGGNAIARFTHLQNTPFRYRLQVYNSGRPRRGTVRLFLLPCYGERGTLLSFNDQRKLAIEMDKWTVTLNSGMNNISRSSADSSVTIPYERTFRSQRSPTPGSPDVELFQFCGCGWPQHMLLPKGRLDKQDFDLFAIISDFTLDEAKEATIPDRECRTSSSFCGDIENRIPTDPISAREPCNDSVSFCGLRDRIYPDRRAMGYPLDRRNPVTGLDRFVAKATNMASQRISITHSNRTFQ